MKIAGEVALTVGLTLISFSVTLMIRADFGLSTISSLPYVLSCIFSGPSFGAWNLIFQIVLLVILLSITRRFKTGYIISFLLAGAFGMLLDLFASLLSGLPTDILARTLYAVVAYVIMCLAISLMLGSKIPLMIVDSFIYDLSKHYEATFRRTKTLIDVVLVILSVALSVTFLGDLAGVGIGTVIMAFITGTGVHAVTHYLRKAVVIEPWSKTLRDMAT